MMRPMATAVPPTVMLLSRLLDISKRNLVVRGINFAHFLFGKFFCAFILELVRMVFSNKLTIRGTDFFFGRSRGDTEDGIWIIAHHLLLFFQVLDVGERFPKHHTAASRGQADRNDIIHKSAVSLIRQKSEISVNGLFRLDESLLGNFASVLKF